VFKAGKGQVSLSTIASTGYTKMNSTLEGM
jgi:hypothetical protein